LKNSIYIWGIILILFSCTAIEKKTVNLPEGQYYAKSWRYSDTITFKPYTSDVSVGGWTELFWTISKDSIYQRDTRGMTYSSCKEKSTYQIENDTLTLFFNGANQPNNDCIDREAIEQKYKIEIVNDTLIKVVRINPMKLTNRYLK
jgi:hypothetical protein